MRSVTGSFPWRMPMKASNSMPYDDLEHSKIDHHRLLRKGVQEVVFGEGKTLSQLFDIVGFVQAKGP